MKIFVFGWAHCGTTILRKIIGDHSEVDEVTHEQFSPPEYGDKPHIVFKYPDLPTRVHRWCKRVMIMRNPWDVFGGHYMRLGPKIFGAKFDKALQAYLNHLRYFEDSTPDFKFRYEDIWTKDMLPKVFMYVGLSYEGVKQDRQSELTNRDPGNFLLDALASYRTKQINAPFKDRTGISAVHLPREYSAEFLNHAVIKREYGDFEYLGNRGR